MDIQASVDIFATVEAALESCRTGACVNIQPMRKDP